MTMRIVVLGLSLSSSWGNGHATTWRALLGALAERGHDVVFLERNRPWYARHRDLKDPDWCRLTFYDELADLEEFAPLVASADVVIVGSYVPDGVDVAEWVQRTASGTVAFYDIDTPVTLARLRAGECEYLTPDLIPQFDLYLSFTGGPTLRFIEEVYGAPAARVLHCSVDEARYRATPAARRWHLGYLGTYSHDRQPALERLLIEPARRAPDLRFVVAGPQYPADIDWPLNVERIEHLPPTAHPQFYSSLCWALNVTRADMIAAGHSPSVRLFEAGACGAPILTDEWPGLDDFFEPSKEVMVARSTEDVLSAVRWSEDDRLQLADAGRRRVLAEHTARHRANEFEAHIAEVAPARARNAGRRSTGANAASARPSHP
jgi:spore maturation protein CgeB